MMGSGPTRQAGRREALIPRRPKRQHRRGVASKDSCYRELFMPFPCLDLRLALVSPASGADGGWGKRSAAMLAVLFALSGCGLFTPRVTAIVGQRQLPAGFDPQSHYDVAPFSDLTRIAALPNFPALPRRALALLVVDTTPLTHGNASIRVSTIDPYTKLGTIKYEGPFFDSDARMFSFSQSRGEVRAYVLSVPAAYTVLRLRIEDADWPERKGETYVEMNIPADAAANIGTIRFSGSPDRVATFERAPERGGPIMGKTPFAAVEDIAQPPFYYQF